MIKTEGERALTSIENKFELNQLHVNDIRSYGFMGQAHPQVFNFHGVALEGIV